MFAQIIFFPHTASTTAWDVDKLFLFLLCVTGIVSLLVAFLLIYFSIRYRRRPGTPTPGPMPGNRPLELFWTLTPLAIFMVFFVWGATVYFGAYRPPDDATRIYGIGKQWMWKFQHPEGQREINELHVAVDEPFQVVLTSEDVIHSFFVPDFRIHMDVLPGRYTSVWFQPTRVGTYHLFCSQYCGTAHANMVGRVVVMEKKDYRRWLQLHAEGSPAKEGEKIFRKYRCISCHTGTGTGRGPALEDLYGRVVHYHLPGETGKQNWHEVVADDAYLRESILYPGAKIVAGYQDLMPTFRGQVTEEEIIQLIAFIRSQHRGSTPPRVESYPPPTNTPPVNPKGKT